MTSKQVIEIENLVDIDDMLSSTTYRTDFFNRCVYCHEYVENDYYEYNNDFYQPYRCNCENAKKELALKLEILVKFQGLILMNECIDVDKVRQRMFEYQLELLKEEFEIED
jgi:hypothetical protein